MTERKRIIRWFWAWNDDKEERWLEQMARGGWHLVSGPFLYTFEKGVPAEVRYRLDYQSDAKGIDEYLRLCRDSGWERVFHFAGWQYMRTASSEAPEIYTDDASRVAKYQRLLAICVTLALCTGMMNFQTLLRDTSGPHTHGLFIGLRVMVIFILCLWAYILARLALHIRKLKRKCAAA